MSPRWISLFALGLLLGCEQAGFQQLARKSGLQKAVDIKPHHVQFEDQETVPAPAARGLIQLVPLGGHEHGNTSGAEISAFDTRSRRLFTVNGSACSIDIQDLTNPANPQFLQSIEVVSLGRPTSVAARHGMIAATVMGKDKETRGNVLFLSSEGKILNQVQVGFEPDMLTFSPDGHWLLVANEGEPQQDYVVDPEGSVSLIDVSKGAEKTSQADVTHIGFEKFNSQRNSLGEGVRIYEKSKSVAQDLEPEYIAVSSDSQTAWVTLQENNAIAVIDLKSRQVTRLVGLGFKDHSLPGNGLDASDKDGKIRIRNWPVKGMYQPDGIAAFDIDGVTYLITANEGELREFVKLNEQARVAGLSLNPSVFPDAKQLQKSEHLGRLRVSNQFGDLDGDGQFEELYSAGARSFSIWSADVQLIFDSGDQFERILAEKYPAYFNSNHEAVAFDDRSDNKGCEPESVAVGKINGRTCAFIALERMGGIMVYDVSTPAAPVFESYLNTRDFKRETGDSGPEGVLFIPDEESPNGKPMLIVSYEISGTTRFFEIQTSDATDASHVRDQH